MVYNVAYHVVDNGHSKANSETRNEEEEAEMHVYDYAVNQRRDPVYVDPKNL